MRGDEVLRHRGTGKVGNAVARHLAERGDAGGRAGRDVAAARGVLPAGIELARGDVTDPASVHAAAEGIDGVFNCMGIYEQWLPDEGLFDRVNAQGAANVVAAARRPARNGPCTPRPSMSSTPSAGGTLDESRLADYPKGTAYERSKQHAEELVLAEARRRLSRW